MCIADLQVLHLLQLPLSQEPLDQLVSANHQLTTITFTLEFLALTWHHMILNVLASLELVCLDSIAVFLFSNPNYSETSKLV